MRETEAQSSKITLLRSRSLSEVEWELETGDLPPESTLLSTMLLPSLRELSSVSLTHHSQTPGQASDVGDHLVFFGGTLLLLSI